MATPCQLVLLVLSWASTAVPISQDPTARVASTRLVSPRLLSVTDTYQGCVNSTLLEEAAHVYYVDLEDVRRGKDTRTVDVFRQ